MVPIDNSTNKYSIFQAYNLGLKRSKGSVICFLHDDVILHTSNWGLKIIEIFSRDKEIGLVGVVGSKFKSSIPSAWWHCSSDNYVINLIQHTQSGKVRKQIEGFKNHSFQEEVAVIDGVFMAMRKVDGIKFDSCMNGYHNYDLNLSFEFHRQGYKVMVTNEILIEHLSEGTIDKSWYNSSITIHKNNLDILPLAVGEKNIRSEERVAGLYFINEALKYDDKGEALKVLLKIFYMKPISKYHFGLLIKIVFNKPLLIKSLK